MEPQRLSSLLFMLIMNLASACFHPSSEDRNEYGESTRSLIKLTEDNLEFKSMLIASIETARQINPDRKTNPVQNLEAYFTFISYCETAMPWSLLEQKAAPEVYSDISKSLRYFYFLVEQPLPELEGRGYYNNTVQYAEPFASWLVEFSRNWGHYLESEDSWNDEYYQFAVQDSSFGLHHGWYEDPSHWKSFNDFFSRRLRSADQRPIAAPDDHSVVVSFADSRPIGIWSIDSASNIVVDNGVPVKSATVKSIINLIGEDSQYENAFANGTFSHSFLSIGDYHRYHFPVSGKVKEVRIIQGGNLGGGEMHWDPENQRYAYDPFSKIGWQTLETRGCVILDTEVFGLVALLPVGMGTIGSVNFESNVTVGTHVKKGDPLGYFLFGGSDFIILFQDHVLFTLDAPKEENGTTYQHLLMGERLGLLSSRTAD